MNPYFEISSLCEAVFLIEWHLNERECVFYDLKVRSKKVRSKTYQREPKQS